MKIEEFGFSGCYLITPRKMQDARGAFVKNFQASLLKKHDLEFDLQEEFYSISAKHVFRGLHFQTPPAAHAKIVYCATGQVTDFILDLRKSSPTYGQHKSVVLSGENGLSLYMPVGIAHGFYTHEEKTIMMYKTTSEYSANNDDGILWQSTGIELDAENIVISERDQSFQSLNEFKSPF